MATLSQYLFVTGALLLLFAFVADIAYTTLLAAGRRVVTATTMTPSALRLAPAGPDMDGPGTSAEALAPAPAASTAGAIGHGLTWASFLLMGGSLLARATIVERGPWGNMYEFSIAFAVGILGSYLFLQRRWAWRCSSSVTPLRCHRASTLSSRPSTTPRC